MATESAATKAISRAARDVLRPMGLTQKGRSRTWLDDHGWWAVVVEFQPLGYSPGSYLNVGACWLWQPQTEDASLHFDEGHRIQRSFTTFESEEQFAEAATALAVSAADEVRALRRRFAAPSDAVGHLEDRHRNAGPDIRVEWNLAMALALAGRHEEARAIARRDQPAGAYEWVVNLQRELARLGPMSDDELRASVRANIAATRTSLGRGQWDASFER